MQPLTENFILLESNSWVSGVVSSNTTFDEMTFVEVSYQRKSLLRDSNVIYVNNVIVSTIGNPSKSRTLCDDMIPSKIASFNPLGMFGGYGTFQFDCWSWQRTVDVSSKALATFCLILPQRVNESTTNENKGKLAKKIYKVFNPSSTLKDRIRLKLTEKNYGGRWWFTSCDFLSKRCQMPFC